MQRKLPVRPLLTWTVAAICACTFGTTILGSSLAGASNSKETNVKIGLIVPTTGPLASGGAEIVAGSKAAATVWNDSHHGSKASVSTCNSQGTASGGLQCVYKLQGSVDAIAGPDFSTDYPGALPALQSSGKFVGTLAAVAKPASKSSIFVVQPSVPDAVTAMMGHFRSQGYKRIGVLVDQEPAGAQATSAAASFAKKHGMTIKTASFPDTATTAVPALQQLLSNKPQAILVWVIGNAGQTVLGGISNLNVTTPVTMNYFNLSPALFVHASLPTDNKVSVLGSTQFLPQSSKSVQQFNRAYSNAIHQPPSWAGSVAGNSIDLVMAAATGGGTSTKKMVTYVEHRTSPIPGPAIGMLFSTKSHVANAPAEDWAFLRYDAKSNSWVEG